MHNMQRYIAGRTSLHKGKRHGEQGRHAGLPLHGHTDTAVAKPTVGVTALGRCSIHFDVKQINTIIWETETELTEKLSKRIEATIK
jgi:hypothetical protein